jgi:hypothetical protein
MNLDCGPSAEATAPDHVWRISSEAGSTQIGVTPAGFVAKVPLTPTPASSSLYVAPGRAGNITPVTRSPGHSTFLNALRLRVESGADSLDASESITAEG